MRRVTVLALTFVIPAICGCGTIANVQGFGNDGAKIYGGVRFEAEAFHQFVTGSDVLVFKDDSGNERKIRGPFCWVGMLAPFDMPLTLVGDTITLPYTIPSEIWHALKTRDAPCVPADPEWEKFSHLDATSPTVASPHPPSPGKQ